MEIDFDWRSVVRTVAPLLGTALGGPLAGLATRTIADALLGRPDAAEPEIAEAVRMATPEQLVALKNADSQFKVRMRELDIKLEEIAVADRDSARRRDPHDWTPRVLAFVIVGGFLTAMVALLGGWVDGLKDPITAALIGSVIGYASAKADQVVAYYFGSSAGSKQKTDALSEALARK